MGYQSGPMVIQLIVTCFHFVWCYLLTFNFDMGARGAGIATSITHFSSMIGTYVYTEKALSKEMKEKTWFTPFRSDVKSECLDIKGLINYFKLGIPSTGMLCLGWWAFEIMTLLAAYISL
jgi:multidrug resistance protein, MATE family